MFTGLVRGKIRLLNQVDCPSGRILTFELPVDYELSFGSSISLNGVCVTVSNLDVKKRTFDVDVMGITLSITNLSKLSSGDLVNFELPLKVQDFLDGHLVQGHVDAIVELVQKNFSESWVTYRFKVPEGLERYLVAKGSVTLNGVSLTISAISDTWFEVSLIPTTIELTNLGSLKAGDFVNLEVDIVAKYVESLLRNSR